MPVYTGMTDSGGSLRLAVRHPQPFCHPRMGLSGIQCRCPHPLRFGDNLQWLTHWIVQLTNSNAFHFWNWSFTTTYVSNIATLVFNWSHKLVTGVPRRKAPRIVYGEWLIVDGKKHRCHSRVNLAGIHRVIRCNITFIFLQAAKKEPFTLA